MLRHLAAGGEAQDFPGTKYENLALARTVERRGLIAWDGEGNRYVLTPAGWSELTPRRFGLPALLVSTATGAAIGAAALAFMWLPGAQWQAPARGHAAVLAAQSPAAMPASGPAAVGGRSVAPMSASAAPGVPAARSTGAEPSAAPANPSEPAEIAGQPAAEQPIAPAPTIAKRVVVKKPHRRVARPEPYNPFAGQWRGRESAQARYGQGSWYSYR